MPVSVSADPEVAEAMARREADHVEALQQLQGAMRESMDVEFVSTPVDKHGNPLEPVKGPPTVEEALEEAHRKRVLAGTAKAAGEESWRNPARKEAPASAPSLVATLEHELSSACARLGELRANYLLQERALLAQVEAIAGKVQMAKEMSK